MSYIYDVCTFASLLPEMPSFVDVDNEMRSGSFSGPFVPSADIWFKSGSNTNSHSVSAIWTGYNYDFSGSIIFDVDRNL
jgi:hypothetical protein